MAKASNLRVLIVGASIAGPTAAYWFARIGAQVTIIERFPELRKGGQNVDIRTVGVTVMQKIPGMEEAVRAKRAPFESVSLVGSDGRPYGTLRPTGDPHQQSLVSEYEIFRGDLARILYDMTKDNENVKYVFGEQLASLEQPEDGNGPVIVQFANGYPTAQYDLVVACDGATSRTRSMGLGCGLREHTFPLNMSVTYFASHKSIPEESDGCGQGYSASGGRTLVIMGDPSSGASRGAFIEVHSPKDPEPMVPLRNAIKKGDNATKEYIAERFGGAGWRTDEAIAVMKDADDFYASESMQVKLPTLSRGRFVLVGDAGYAPGSTGTGTSLALAGAYVLAGEVSKSKDDLSAALKGYEETMRPLIDDLQKIPSLGPRIMAPQTEWGIWLRNSVFTIMCKTKIHEWVQKYGGEAFASTDKHKVPDYDWDL